MNSLPSVAVAFVSTVLRWPRRGNHWRLAGWLVCCLWLNWAGFADAAETPRPLHFHVAASRGDNTGPGTLDRPFHTIQAAHRAVRSALAAGHLSDITVFIHPGDYYFEKSLKFGLADAGTNGQRVTYRNFSQRPVLIGGRLLTNWTHVGVGIFRTPIGSLRPNALLENEEGGLVARTPNRGYLAVAGAGGSPEKPELQFRPKDLPTLFNPQGAQVLVWAGYDEQWDGGKNYNWEATLVPIASVDFERHALTLAHGTIRSLHAQNRYYVRGARAFLDARGEFWVDTARELLFYKPRNTPIRKQRIVAAAVDRLIEVVGESADRPVANLRFEGLTFRLGNAPDSFGRDKYIISDGLCYLRNAQCVEILNCHISHSGLSGVALNGPNVSNVVAGSRIEQCAYSGITSRGYWIGGAPYPDEKAAYINHHNAFTNNHIHHCGRLIGQAAGINLYQSGHNQIAHNRIEDMPRYGIRFDGCSYGTLLRDPAKGGLGGKLFGKPITWENHLDFIYTRSNHVMGNVLQRCMLDSQDGGAICVFGTGAGNCYAGNVIKDMHSSVSEGLIAGIYLDDASNLSIVADNIITRLVKNRYVYPLIIKGYDNIASNNIIALNEASAAVYIMQTPGGGLPPSEGYPEELTDRVVLERNIFHRNGSSEIYRFWPWKDTMVSRSDYNVIWPPEPPPEFKLGTETKRWEQWRRLPGQNFDRHSRVADPQFRNPMKLDFRLRQDSPARNLRIRELDASRSGITMSTRIR